MHEHTGSDELSPLFRLCATRQYMFRSQRESLALCTYLCQCQAAPLLVERRRQFLRPPSRAEMLSPRK